MELYDLIIIGGGPAGAAAGVYAARKRLKTVLLGGDFVGQSSVSTDIQNWIGTISISGEELSKSLRKHVEAYASDILQIRKEFAQKIERNGDILVVTTEAGSYQAKAVLVATGSHRRKLDAKNADTYEHKGLTYCASCDGPMFADQDVVVVGGGNAAFETAAQLLAYAKSVTLINRTSEFRADPITVEKMLAREHFRIIKNAVITEVKGEMFVTGITYKNNETGEEVALPVGGIFVEIGQLPNTEFVKGVVDTTASGHVVVDPRTQKTSVPGIWAAGDCTDALYHQNNIAVGDAVRALEDIYVTLHTK